MNQRRRMRRIASYRSHADAEAVIEAVRRKVLVMAVTAGRTGTTYLARLLRLFPDTTSLHEPAPHYAYVLRQAQHTREAARRFLVDYKLPSVAAVPGRRYAEISHLFCKGFFEPLLELGIVPGFVMLRRPPRLVARSWLTRGVVPGRSKRGLKLHLHPSDPGVLPFPEWWRATDYQLCFWYALEIEHRQRRYAAWLDRLGARWVDVTADELHDPVRFLALGQSLRLFDPSKETTALLEQHRIVSAIVHKPNGGPPAPAAPEEEEAVWAAVVPHAGDLRAAIDRRYGTAAV
jgi:hypothetical protein